MALHAVAHWKRCLPHTILVLCDVQVEHLTRIILNIFNSILKWLLDILILSGPLKLLWRPTLISISIRIVALLLTLRHLVQRLRSRDHWLLLQVMPRTLIGVRRLLGHHWFLLLISNLLAVNVVLIALAPLKGTQAATRSACLYRTIWFFHGCFEHLESRRHCECWVSCGGLGVLERRDSVGGLWIHLRCVLKLGRGITSLPLPIRMLLLLIINTRPMIAQSEHAQAIHATINVLVTFNNIVFFQHCLSIVGWFTCAVFLIFVVWVLPLLLL